MTILINAFKGINKFGLALALLTAIILMSFSTTKQKATSTQYGRTSSGWVLVDDENFYCNEQDNEACKVYFLNDPNGPDPQVDNTQAPEGEGIYEPIPN